MTEKKPLVVAGNNITNKTRNPSTIIQIVLNLFLPILAYLQMEPTDFTNWNSVGQLFVTIGKNPILVLMMLNGFWGIMTDPNVKSWWADNIQNRLKVEPTLPHEDIKIKGEKVVTDESEIFIDNTEIEKHKPKVEEL